ncbi:hypothetical protein [Cupriavidus pauculus]|uniref:hypothetical protein n=1 Tax=Cupriavidus pauculus TaxID=82633 RepID=UPI001EE17BA2|nr:hypothetical protein [Cupriavidus pauculus]GJG94805.1 hypothetical protein CBA19C6_09970 [Cupriavidus pauculus]
MKASTMALAVAVMAVFTSGLAVAAGPANPADRYDYNMRTTNKDGYVPDPARVSNKDGYVPDTARAGDKFDPYTQGANQGTASALTDSKATKSTKKSSTKAQKKTPAAQ